MPAPSMAIPSPDNTETPAYAPGGAINETDFVIVTVP